MVFAGCAANVGPMIGTELEVGDASAAEGLPDEALAILPLGVTSGELEVAAVQLIGVQGELVSIGRRMLGDEEPDKARELSSDDFDAIGEVLNLMSAAVDQALRDGLGSGLHAKPLSWWRSDEPGENELPDSESLFGTASLSIPDGPAVRLWLVIPASLLELEATVEAETGAAGKIALIGLEESQQSVLKEILESARFEVVSADSLSPSEGKEIELVFLGTTEAALRSCRELRLGDLTWTLPLIACCEEPTQERVVALMHDGASHVLAMPTEELTLLRILEDARRSNASAADAG